MANPQVWSKTVFFLMYDENDGFFDHAPSDLAPLNAAMGKTTLADIGAYETVPPAVQALPAQDTSVAGGPRPACALPYELVVHGRVAGAKQFELNFANSGQAGAAFIVHSSVRKDGPWYYTVEAGKQIDREVWQWPGRTYELSVRGANGYLRQFKGALTANGARPELQTRDDSGNGDISLVLSNLEGREACRFTVTDNAYGARIVTHSVAAGQALSVRCALSGSFGWYDFSVTSEADPKWLRRVAGHVETGRASRTDPMIGRGAGKQTVARNG